MKSQWVYLGDDMRATKSEMEALVKLADLDVFTEMQAKDRTSGLVLDSEKEEVTLRWPITVKQRDLEREWRKKASKSKGLICRLIKELAEGRLRGLHILGRFEDPAWKGAYKVYLLPGAGDRVKELQGRDECYREIVSFVRRASWRRGWTLRLEAQKEDHPPYWWKVGDQEA